MPTQEGISLDGKLLEDKQKKVVKEEYQLF